MPRRDPTKRMINFYCNKILAKTFKDICDSHGVVMRFQMEKLISDFVNEYIEDAKRHNDQVLKKAV